MKTYTHTHTSLLSSTSACLVLLLHFYVYCYIVWLAMVDCCIFNVMYIVYCFICHQVDCCIIPRTRAWASRTFFFFDDVVLLFGWVRRRRRRHSNSNDVKRIYGEEDRTTNQLTEEGRMSYDSRCINSIFCVVGAPFCRVSVHHFIWSIVDRRHDVDVKRCTT